MTADSAGTAKKLCLFAYRLDVALRSETMPSTRRLRRRGSGERRWKRVDEVRTGFAVLEDRAIKDETERVKQRSSDDLPQYERQGHRQFVFLHP